ncbi:MAG: hypothetical protein HY329_24575 [Chloroflexi bacterium]|nr:hypothetical protein [Chloroflexota bacterium]
MLGRTQRVALIREIEKQRDSRLLAYICSDRQGAAAQIGDDAVRPMYDHVRRIGPVERLSLYLYSRGGAVEVPWRIVSMLRESCRDLEVLIPYRALSAATMIALGCDRIVMGPKAELGPIDPALKLVVPQENGTAIQDEIRIEDVMSYVDFIKDKANIVEQTALAEQIKLLGDRLSPWVLGNIYRTHSHIRMVARRLLNCRKERSDDAKIDLIVKALAEEMYLHGHGIARTEAKDLGLPVEEPDDVLERLLWNLLTAYEDVLEMRRPLDAEALLGPDTDETTAPVNVALIESSDLTWAFRGELKVRRIRQAPTEVNINVTLGVTLPPDVQPTAVPAELVNQLARHVQEQAPRIVRDQVRRQSPVLRVESGLRSAYWQDVTTEDEDPSTTVNGSGTTR